MAEVDKYLRLMIKKGASDFHLSSGEVMTIRVDGKIRQAVDASSSPFSSDDVKRLITEIMPERNQKEFLKGFDTDFAYDSSAVGRLFVWSLTETYATFFLVSQSSIRSFQTW